MSDKAIAKRMARFVAKNGLKHEKKCMKIKDARINFLRSTEDPLHGYYKQKLSEYLSQIQNYGDIVDVDDDDDDVSTITSSQVVTEPPPGIISNNIERMARYISKMGLVGERMMLQSIPDNARYSFMLSSDPFHAFYKQKLTHYLSQNQPDIGNVDAAAYNRYASADYDAHYDAAVAATAAAYQKILTEDQGGSAAPRPRYLFQPQPIFLPNGLECRLPKGMRGFEFKTMKLTAQFGAWYGNDFWLGFKNRDGFEFTNPTDTRFPRFTRFVLEYSEVMKPPKGLKEKVSKNDAYMAAIHDGFFRLLHCDSLQEMEWRLGGVMSMIDWHSSLDKDFPEELPPETGTGTSPPEPEPKRQNFDESGLVPEDQFLAQHPGWCTIRISVDYGIMLPLVIEITVQSLSETVGSFKEKIAEELRTPPEHQMLFGKAGLLKENKKSLAHYNVGAGEILTLSPTY